MDISEAVTVQHKMKRGNYAVSDSNYACNGIANGNTSGSNFSKVNIRHEAVCDNRQARASEVRAGEIRNREKTNSLCVEYRVQRKSIQRGLSQQIKWSTWSLAITMGETRMVISQTDIRSAQVCATSV